MDGIDTIIEEIQAAAEAREDAADRVRREGRTMLFQNGGAVEDDLVHDVAPAPLDDVTVTGIDGGMARSALHGLDVVMVRAVAACCRYVDGELAETTYHPSPNPTPRLEHVAGTAPRQVVDRRTTLERLSEEVTAATAVTDASDVLLLDGALAPQEPDRPAEDSAMFDAYETVLDAYRELYDAARDGLLLAGVVEDTRASTFCDVLAANGFDGDTVAGGRDTTLLHHLLEPGERTLLMEYGDTDTHPILADLPQHRQNLYTCYLRSAPHDRPIRIDLYAQAPSRVAEQLLPVVHALAGVGQSYSVPAPLIEADQRAGLSGHEVDLVTNRITSRLAHLTGTDPLRRDRRPF